jgi:hypothetical protein
MNKEDKIVDFLEQILKVSAIQATAGKSVTDGARILKLAGLDNQTIAEVLNTSPGTVRSVTANLRTKRRGSGKNGNH